MSEHGGSQSTPSFRRRLVVAPRRRARPLARALAFVLRLGVVALPLGGVAAWVLTSSAFSLHTLEVIGNRRVSSEWVQGELRSDLGQNLVRLDLASLDARLCTHPWIRSVELRKRLPHHLRLQVREHRAAALLELDETLAYLSDEGRLITTYDGGSEDPQPYLVIGYRASAAPEQAPSPSAHETTTVESGRDVPELRRALALVGRLEEATVAWSAGLERIEILGEEEYLLRIHTLPFPVLVRADLTTAKARALDELLPRIVAGFEPLQAIDLRFSRRIVVKGAAQSPREATG